MKVAYCVERFWPSIGGVEISSMDLVPRLRDRGHEVEVLVGTRDAGEPERDRVGGIPVRRFAISDSLRERNLERFAVERAKLLRAWGEMAPDVVEVLFSGPSPIVIEKARQAHSTPLVLFVVNRLGAGGEGGLGEALLRSAAWVVGHSEWALRAAIAREPGLEERSSVIPNALAPPASEPEVSTEPALIATAGRHIEGKGFDVLLRAFAAIARERDDARLVLAGEGPLSGELRLLCSQLGVSDRVELPGWVAPEECWRLYRRASIVVVPSTAPEGFGLVALQGSMMATPVVASAAGGLGEVVDDGRTGLLVEPGDEQALIAALRRLLTDPVSAAEMGVAGARRAADRFSLERVSDMHDRLLRSLGDRAPLTGIR